MNLYPKFVDEAAGPPAQAVGTTVADIWNLTIGSHVSLWNKKQQFRQQQNYLDYIKKVEEKTQKIPEENVVEPQLHIIGPAIEASKHYIESEELREMFANLIASSIDQRLQPETHPAFVEIIKQLSPFDAFLLKQFKEKNDLPIVQIRVENSINPSFNIIQNHIMNLINQDNYKMQASSVSNLQRLGLLHVDYSFYTSESNGYDFINTHPAFIYANENLPSYTAVDPNLSRIGIRKGVILLTPLGESFIHVCL